ncbi:T9SS-dependent choice-of-anchor J family protein [Flavobacterium wongokense]|uniref:T9SS-dependent choice-of-anchor J family protein n=1 Tax=Flavobacterium wongokense TaxID=2910674 RepID=UPI001F2E38A9|nr:choice-of-anchor J domain-containing protein [Flavobacterium sp. WG47]MCF6132078.1 choice-of-anchor J domain-containing protein [Flavobacterium sp. WG47]
MKKITLLFLFLIGSITSSFGQFTEGFESGIPGTWTVINDGDANTWVAFTTPTVFVLDGTTSAVITYSATAHDDYLITPAITVVAGVNDRFSFWARSFDVDYPEEFDLVVSTTTPTNGAFTDVIDTVAPNSADTTYTEYTYDLSAYVGQTIYIGMHSTTTDKWRISVDHVVNDALPSAAPDCVTLTAPANAATGVDYLAGITLTWDAATTGVPAASYDVYLDTNAAPTTLLGNTTALTGTVNGLLASTTYYWKVVAKNLAGEATGCSVFSFTTMANPVAPYCGPITFTNNVEPITLVNFAGINNVTDPTLNGTPDHEIFASPTGAVTAGSSYTITIQGNTDGNFTNRFMVFADWNQDNDFADADEAYTITQTITNSTGTDAITATQSLLVPPTALAGSTRMRVKKIYGTTNYTDPCLGTGFGQVEDYTLVVTAAPSDLPDYANLQWPPTGTIVQGAGTVTVYGQVYEGGLTDVAPNIVGQAPGINAWVGYSTDDTNPNTWTNWFPATWNSGAVGNNDEYQYALGTGLLAGTYYYATRFQLNGGAFVYGGIDPVGAGNPGNFWDGTTFKSGVLTVTPPPPPANDACGGAIALTPGNVFGDHPVTGTVLNATDATETPSCAFNNTQNSDVWYTVVVPASGTITIETQAEAANSLGDTTIAAFTGTCGGALTEVGCDDDAGTGLFSLLSLTGLTAGDTLYIGVWKWGTDAPTDTENQFKVSAYDASLATGSFDNANFAYYPNPVKNVLNLSYTKEISNVDVFNLLGQKVSANAINANNAQIDMSNLANGTYMVKVTSDNQVKTIRVIKQ